MENHSYFKFYNHNNDLHNFKKRTFINIIIRFSKIFFGCNKTLFLPEPQNQLQLTTTKKSYSILKTNDLANELLYSLNSVTSNLEKFHPAISASHHLEPEIISNTSNTENIHTVLSKTTQIRKNIIIPKEKI